MKFIEPLRFLPPLGPPDQEPNMPRYQAKRYLLTFSDLAVEDRDDWRTWLTSKLQTMADICDLDTAVPAVKYAVGGLEAHQNGSPHVHVAIYFISKYRFTGSMDIFDRVFSQHPNIVTVNNWKATLEYVTKDDQFVVHGPFDLKAFLEGGPYYCDCCNDYVMRINLT